MDSFKRFNGVVENVNYEKEPAAGRCRSWASTPVELDFSQVEKA